MIFPDGTEKLLTEEGYVLEKHLFERWLADEAVAKGAELHLHHRVTGMERIYNSENQFSNWKLEGQGDEFPIECAPSSTPRGFQAPLPSTLTWAVTSK